MVDAFSYHCSKHITAPDEEKMDKNIKGLELEIDDYDAADYLEDLIYDDIVTSPENEGNTDERIAIEYDGSVDWELIFRADTIRPLLDGIKKLNQYGLHEENICNSAGTSCHIHYNRQYLNNREIDRVAMQQAVEFNGMLMYLFSGRSEQTLREWCRTSLACSIEDDLLTKAKLIDRINDISYNRYNIINFGGRNTDELRIFSNKCNFDYKTIRFYLEYSDMIVELADMMKEKSYEEHLDECVEFVDTFMTSRPRRKIFYDRYNIDSILLSSEELAQIRIIKLWNKINSRIENFEQRIENQSNYDNSLSFIRLVRDLNSQMYGEEPINIVFNPTRADYESLTEDIREQYRRRYDL